MSIRPWQYRARATRVVDGDTIDLEVDLGFAIYHRVRVRLAGLDAPEIRGRYVDREAGEAATEYLRVLAHKGVGDWPLLLETKKTGKYGRWLGTLFYYDPGESRLVNVNKAMIDAGHAEED